PLPICCFYQAPRSSPPHLSCPGTLPDPPVLQPCLKLGYGVGILKAGQFVGFSAHLIREHQVTGNGLFHQFHINLNATVIDSLIHMIKIPFLVQHWEPLQYFTDITLCTHVLGTVIFKLLPPLWVMLRKVPCPAAITFCRLT